MTPHITRRGLVVLLGLGAALAAMAIAGWIALGVLANRPAPPVTTQEARRSVHRATDWLRRHESQVLVSCPTDSCNK